MQILGTSIDSVLHEENKLYFFDRACNAIWQSDKSLCKIEFLRGAATDVELKQFSSFGIFRYEDSLFIGSQVCTDILEYKIKQNRFYKYGFCETKNSDKCTYNNVMYGKKIFQFPNAMNRPILIFDMEKKEYQNAIVVSKNKKVTAGFINQEGANVYIPEFGGNVVYEFNMETLHTRQIEFSRRIHLNSICSVRGILYVTDKNQKMLWKKEPNFLETGIQLGNGKSKEVCGRLVCYGKNIIALPRWERFLYIYDIESGLVSKIEVPLKADMKLGGSGSLFFGCYVHNSKLYFLPWIFPEVYVFDFVTKSFEIRYLKYTPNMAFLSCWPILFEDGISLGNYITAVQEGKCMRGKNMDSEFAYGKRIYEEVGTKL